MAYNNTAKSGATQYNIGIQLVRNNNVQLHLISRTTTVAAAQQFGSPVDTRYSFQPLQDVIQATNQGDIIARRYHGEGIYTKMKGMITNAFGYTEEKMMEELVTKNGENTTQLGTIIVCLSVALSKTTLCQVLASAIMLLSHNKLDKSMNGDIIVLQNRVEKYANSILSRDGMCNKLENAKEIVQSLVKSKAPQVKPYTMFLPPRSAPEENDFVEFVVRLWSVKADGEKIYTRSVKLMSLALLLSEYGWQIDVFVENEDSVIIPIKADTNSLSVIYSPTSAGDRSREYVENHGRHIRSWRNSRFHPTAVCSIEQMAEVTGRCFSTTEDNYNCFMMGYNAVRKFCDEFVSFNITVQPSGQIGLRIDTQGRRPPELYQLRCEKVLNRYVPSHTPTQLSDLVVSVLYHEFPEYDWNVMEEEIVKQKNPDAVFTWTLEHFKGNCEKLWSLVGTIICILDKIVLSFVNLPNGCQVRIPVGQSILEYISECCRQLKTPFSSDEPHGLEAGHVVQLCAVRLAGLNPPTGSLALSTAGNIIGYWNAQQGLMVTSVFERCLYHDLPPEKSKPLTFYNIPMMGITTDETGWIIAGRILSSTSSVRRKPHSKNSAFAQCDVVMEYRPDFEADPNTIVAGVYIGGVFCHLMELRDTLSSEWYNPSRCNHLISDEETPSTAEYIALSSLEPGESALPPDGQIAVVGPQLNEVSKMFSALLYRSFSPILQYGCRNCALQHAKDENRCIVISKVDSTMLDESVFMPGNLKRKRT
ncbi:hypothetical protein F4810DRAFT_643865 [Camillea tinctor]|nr:hypothetical protein F4810DRAFT_643865 [Camillea tinctor]